MLGLLCPNSLHWNSQSEWQKKNLDRYRREPARSNRKEMKRKKPVILVVNPKPLSEDEGDYQVSIQRIHRGGKAIPVEKIFEKYGYTPRTDSNQLGL